MNRTQDPSHDHALVDANRFGWAAGALLNESTRDLPNPVTDRLYRARLSALAARKTEAVPLLSRAMSSNLSLSGGGKYSESQSIWNFLGWAAPFLVLAFGLLAIAEWQQASRINDIAAVDVALLTDDVPPDAYMDSGFLAFLKLSKHDKSELETIDLEQSEPPTTPY